MLAPPRLNFAIAPDRPGRKSLNRLGKIGSLAISKGCPLGFAEKLRHLGQSNELLRHQAVTVHRGASICLHNGQISFFGTAAGSSMRTGVGGGEARALRIEAGRNENQCSSIFGPVRDSSAVPNSRPASTANVRRPASREFSIGKPQRAGRA
jgi:hypothetical protein